MNTALIFFSALSFVGYGSACFFSSRMKSEFERYGLGSQRLLVGALQWCAGVGLVAGVLMVPWVGQTAAGGLTLMMLAAVVVRIHIKDGFLRTIPAIVYLGLNAYLCLAAF